MNDHFQDDLGTTLADYTFEIMQIDEQWSVREPRGYTWWGHELAQRVWAEPIRSWQGANVVRVHAETDFLRDVDFAAKSLGMSAAINSFATLSSIVLYGEQRQAKLHCEANLHAGNEEWLKRLFALAVAIQAAQAHHMAGGLAEPFGGKPDVSAPPSGGRPEPDEMLNITNFFRAIASDDDVISLGASDFESLLVQLTPLFSATEVEGLQLTATIDAQDQRSPSNLRGLFRKEESTSASLLVSAAQPHSIYGDGVLLVLGLPNKFPEEEDAAEFAASLNLIETSESEAHFLGSWTQQKGSVSFVSFLPAISLPPNEKSRVALIVNMVVSTALRARWLSELLKSPPGSH
ncbi:MAG: hypothetical protein H0V26_13060 [Solirubrobacterales bacterium]|nr:hypothetical protein [Solirubrobacterales bacterium]